MGKKLFDCSLSEEFLEEEYFNSAYGSGGKRVRSYLRSISALCSCDYFNGKGPRENGTVAGKMQELENLAAEFLPYIQENIESSREENRSFWQHLEFHSEYIRRLGKALYYLAKGQKMAAGKYWSEFCTFLCQSESRFKECVDVYRVIEVGQRHTGFTAE